MNRFKTLMLLMVCLMVGAGLIAGSAFAGDNAIQTKDKKIIVFHAGASDADRMDYAMEWQNHGATLLMDLPFMNSMVIMVPNTIMNEDLANHPLVKRVDDDGSAKMGYKRMKAQSNTAGDGGAGDGGAGDGGAGDGGAGDGGAGDGGAGDGGAGDGGAGDGGAQLPVFIKPFRDLADYEYPWGTIKSYDQSFDPLTKVDDMYSVGSGYLYMALDNLEENTVKVAIFDTGVDMTHSRLADAVVGGFDALNLMPGIPWDDNGHGTHVAGTLCAEDLGVAPGVELYMVKVLDKKAEGDISSLAMAMQWAISNEIDIVSMSLAYKEDNPIVRLTMEAASAEGMILVAAVGNHFNWEEDGGAGAAGDGGAGDGGAGDGGAGDGGAGDGGAGDGGAGDGGAGDGGAGDGGAGDGGASDGGTIGVDIFPVMYPAKYPEVIAVSAHDEYGYMAAFSNDGPEIDVWAPGTNIVSTVYNDGYGYANGTSMATPHVAGTIALMLAIDPTLSPEQIKYLLNQTAVSGMLNARNAVYYTYRHMIYSTYYTPTITYEETDPGTDPVITTTW